MEKVFNKLVRDKIPEIIESHGEIPTTRILDISEFKRELSKKLMEEAQEAYDAKNKDELFEELSDLYEIMLSIVKAEESSFDEIISIANEKREKRGSFEKRIFLERTRDKE